MNEEDDQQHDLHVRTDGESTDAPADDQGAHPGDSLESGSGTDTDGPDEEDVEGPDPVDAGPEPRPLSLAARNLLTVGQLTLHYPSRDVTVWLDGDAALRLLTMFALRREGGLADPLDPETSEADAGWVVLDLDEPLAMSWTPGLPRKRPRTAVDPAISAA